MKAIDNVYGQRAYNLLSRNTSARQGVMEPPSESVDIPGTGQFWCTISVQKDCRCREPHDKYGRSKRPKSVRITGKGVSDPMYERREPGRLQPQCDYHDTDRYADFTN
jgi:hypothetical protein